VFSHEAYDFTTWMERNPDALSNAIEIELADVNREQDAGDFNVDLFAEDIDGHRVIIENQLEATDHKHLGQVLTYLSVLDADIAIWITADARPEHVSAISWLNENATGADFYLVKVEGVRVDESRAAPLFTRIVGPSEGTRAAGQRKKELNERHRLRKEFYSGLLPKSNQKTNRFSNISPKTRSYISASAGRGFEYLYEAREHVSRATLFLDFEETQEVNDAAFDVLEDHRDEIDAAVDGPLEWTRDESRRRKITFETEGGYRDREDWDAVHERLTQVMAQLERATLPYLDQAQGAASRAMGADSDR
jgi:hypothetical protein